MKTTPKDFFLYVGAMVALYVSSISFVSLLFNVINAAFPDALENSYYYGSYDPYSAGMRISVAALIVFLPIFIALSARIQKELKEVPERAELWVRKWLVYITLFVAGLAVAIDLVTLINSFLSGEITTRFILKVLAVLLVAGTVFMYYVKDLKTLPEDRKVHKSYIIAVIVVVLASIIWSFFVMGSPLTARAKQFDMRRVSDLESIQWQIVSSYQQREKIPATLAELEDPISSFYVPTDPRTGSAYEYEKKSDTSFILCATFEAESEEIRSRGVAYPTISAIDPGISGKGWQHGVGRVCFDRTIDPERYPVFEKAVR